MKIVRGEPVSHGCSNKDHERLRREERTLPADSDYGICCDTGHVCNFCSQHAAADRQLYTGVARLLHFFTMQALYAIVDFLSEATAKMSGVVFTGSRETSTRQIDRDSLSCCHDRDEMNAQNTRNASWIAVGRCHPESLMP